MKVKTGVIIPDLHYPFHDKKYLKALKAITADLNPEYLIYLGDCFDAYGISRHAKADGLIDEEDGVYATYKEILGFKKDIYDPLKELAPNAIIKWTGGNHDEQRTREAIIKKPERAEFLDIHKFFPDAEICEYNKVIKIGKANFTHGVYVNDAHAKKTTLNFEDNVIYGHTHDSQEYTKVTMGNNDVHAGISMGCGCNKNPDYMKNRPNSWVHIVGVIYFLPNGMYNLYKILVFDGKAIFNGKIYK